MMNKPFVKILKIMYVLGFSENFNLLFETVWPVAGIEDKQMSDKIFTVKFEQ